MWPFKKSKSVDDVKQFSSRVQEAQDSYEHQQEEHKQMFKKEVEKMEAQEPVIDFLTMRVVSIERHMRNMEIAHYVFHIPVTVVGYIQNEYNDDNRVKSSYIAEWTIFCNEEHHQKLVNDFKKYLNLRQKGELKYSW